MPGIILITLFSAVIVFTLVFTLSKKSTESKWWLSISLTVVFALLILLVLYSYIAFIVKTSPF